MSNILNLSPDSVDSEEMKRKQMMNAIRNAFEQHAVDVECANCKNNVFNELTKIKRLSSIASPTGEEMIIPYKVYVCSKCSTEYDPS